MRFRILSNRRRAIIALVHTVAFMALAMVQLALGHPTPHFVLHASTTDGSIAMVTIYFIVTTVLIVLFVYSRAQVERLYFALCASSASFGLMRSVYGDPPLHFAQYMRVAMLFCAVLAGTMIVRMHSGQVAAD
jgi:hypothetical protein